MPKFLLAIILLFSFSFAHAQKVKFEYDEFKNVSMLNLDNVNVKDSDGNKATLYFIVSDTGRVIANPKKVSIGFLQTNDSWRYLDCTFANFLIDTLRMNLGETQHRGSAIGYKVNEQLIYKQPLSFLEKLARAQTVRFKICYAEFKLDEKSLGEIKAYWKQIADAAQ